jgi:hypothetical protein
MAKSSLPVLTSIMMVTQAVLATPMGLRAKQSVRSRNQVVLAGIAVLIGANASFAFIPSFYGEQADHGQTSPGDPAQAAQR